MTKDSQTQDRILHPFKVGDYVHFYDSYDKDPKEATKRTGKVTSLYQEHCGVTPIKSQKELYFRPDELMKPGKPRAVQQSLISLEVE